MTENTAYENATRVLLNADSHIDFDPAALVMRDAETFKNPAVSVAYFLSAPVSNGDDDENDQNAPDSFDPLDLDIYRNKRGDYIADVDLTVGGPTIYARYESRWGQITLSASWGANRIECTSKDCPLIDWIESMADCYE